VVTASDNSDLPLIEIASCILIMNSLGSILGPVLVAPVMGALGGEGFFLFGVAGMTLGALWALYRVAVIERPSRHAHRFAMMPRTSFVATELAAEAFDDTDPQPAEDRSERVEETADQDAAQRA